MSFSTLSFYNERKTLHKLPWSESHWQDTSEYPIISHGSTLHSLYNFHLRDQPFPSSGRIPLKSEATHWIRLISLFHDDTIVHFWLPDSFLSFLDVFSQSLPESFFCSHNQSQLPGHSTCVVAWCPTFGTPVLWGWSPCGQSCYLLVDVP